MGAHVEHKFPNKFLLNEERLRKIKSVIETRLGTIGIKKNLSYKVYRGDTSYYETQTVEDVIKEDNEDWRKITRLELLISEGDAMVFALSFSEDGVILKIEGTNRDNIFLMYSDLKTYIENDVTTCGRIFGRNSLFYPLYSMFTVMLVIIAVMFIFYSEPKNIKAEALKSSEIITKLNYLINSGEDTRKFVPWFFGTIIGVSILLFVGSRVYKYIKPGNEFLFGRRMGAYEKRKVVLNKIYWGIGIAFCVAVVAGIIVWLITRQR